MQTLLNRRLFQVFKNQWAKNILFVGLIFAFVSIANGQITSPTIGLDYGSVSGEFTRNETRINYPELQIGLPLFVTSGKRGIISTELIGAYWKDSIDKSFECLDEDCIVFSYSEFSVGTRMVGTLKLDRFEIGLHWGVSRQFGSAKYVSGSGLSGLPAANFTYKSIQYPSGLRLSANVYDNLWIRLGIRNSIATQNSKSAPFMLTFGLAYKISFIKNPFVTR